MRSGILTSAIGLLRDSATTRSNGGGLSPEKWTRILLYVAPHAIDYRLHWENWESEAEFARDGAYLGLSNHDSMITRGKSMRVERRSRATAPRVLAMTAGLLAAIALGSVAGAGVLTVSPALTDDASTGVSTSKTYTHAISGGTAGLLNGVTFDALNSGATPANFNWNTNGFNKNEIACCNNGDWNPAAGGVTGPELINLLGSFTYSGNGDGNPASQTFTLSGLTPGTTYDTRLYVRVWDTEGSGRPIDLTFTNGSEVDSTGVAPEDRPSLVGLPSDQSAFYLSYEYTAQASEVSIDALVVEPAPSGSFHMYALTNEVVPEPGSITLAVFAFLGMLSLRRRPHSV